MIMPSPLLLQAAILISLDAVRGTPSNAFVFEPPPFGDESCPCLFAEELEPFYNATEDFEPTYNVTEELNHVDLTTYGIGCEAHDKEIDPCLPENDCRRKVPRPPSCDNSWCDKEWCYVDRSNCNLYHEPSVYFHSDLGRYYSYATCGNMDRFVNSERINLLKGKNFQVGYARNSGGWKGSYSSDGHFAVDGWEGPIVDFFDRVALEGNFAINRSRPPLWLKERSENFFSNSAFDYCVYATALGYLDFCVGMFSITGQRAAAASFFTLASDPVYLYIFSDEDDDWKSFWSNVTNVFVPFTTSSWFIILLFLFIMSLLFFFHESGSFFELNTCADWKYFFVKIASSCYRVFFGFLSQAYDGEIATIGGRFTSFGMGFFILTTVAMYTANLAAIFTENTRKMKIESMDDAIKAGYSFCGSRSTSKHVMEMYQIAHRFLPDPEDGMPGFNCPTCAARSRTFDFMKNKHNDPTLYCDAAVASAEDIEVMWGEGFHCNKTSVGAPLMYIDRGIPVKYEIQTELTTLLQDIKNRAVFDKIQQASRPLAACPEILEHEMSLSILQLSGIWVITSGFLIAGVVAAVISGCSAKGKKQTSFQPTHNANDTNQVLCA